MGEVYLAATKDETQLQRAMRLTYV